MAVRRACFLIFAILTALPLAAAPTVIVLSLDGVRFDFPDRGAFPGLERMAREGFRGAMTPVYPSNTFPTHVSMATGTYPDVHGIVDNVFWDPVRRETYSYSAATVWLDAEPVWIAAARQGVRAATYFWVGSEQDWRGTRHAIRMAPFDGNRSEAAKVDQILDWLRLPVSERPQLIMAYWAGTDSVAHNNGPDAAEVAIQLGEQDEQLVRLIDGIDATLGLAETTLIVVSDHGMVEVGSALDLAGALADADIVARVHGPTVGHVFLDDPDDLDGAEAVIGAMDHVRVYRKSELPAHWRLGHPDRTGDLVVTTVPPHTLDPPSLALRAYVLAGGKLGSHGYDPNLPEMRAALLAMGARVRKPGVGDALLHQIDLAATITEILGIEAPLQSEGAPMAWLE